MPFNDRFLNMSKYFYYEADEPTQIKASRGSTIDNTKDVPQEEETPADSQGVTVSAPTEIKASRGSTIDNTKDVPQEEEETPTPEQAPSNPTTEIKASRGSTIDNAKDVPQDEPVGEDDIVDDDAPQEDGTEEPAEDNAADVPNLDGGEEEQQEPAKGDQPAEGEQPDQNDQDGEESAEEDSVDAEGMRRKYNLYRDFISLYKSNKSYIEKLESMRPDNIEANIIINSVLTKLHNIDDNLYEFMVMKYDTSTYIQSMIFFQNAIATIRICFGLLRNNEPFMNQTIKISDIK